MLLSLFFVVLLPALVLSAPAPTDLSSNGLSRSVHLPWLPTHAAHHNTHSSNSASKRHQTLLPYHPVVRFRGLGGPGESWLDQVGDLGPLAASSPLLAGFLAEKPSVLEEIQQFAENGELSKEALSAGELLTLLESMVALRDEDSYTKGFHFGVRR